MSPITNYKLWTWKEKKKILLFKRNYNNRKTQPVVCECGGCCLWPSTEALSLSWSDVLVKKKKKNLSSDLQYIRLLNISAIVYYCMYPFINGNMHLDKLLYLWLQLTPHNTLPNKVLSIWGSKIFLIDNETVVVIISRLQSAWSKESSDKMQMWSEWPDVWLTVISPWVSQSVGRACVILRFRLNNETPVNSDSFMFATVAIMWVWPQVSVYFYRVLKKNTFCKLHWPRETSSVHLASRCVFYISM